MIAALQTLLESQQPVEKPLERLGFQRSERVKREVVEQKVEPVLELAPKEGPAGTILLRVRRVGQEPPRVKNAAGKLLPPVPDAYRYWVDPARGHAIVRWAMIGGARPDTTIIDRMARSPSGVWYATRIRRKDAIRHSDGTTSDQVHDIHVDFNVDLPDSLFEPPSPGRIR